MAESHNDDLVNVPVPKRYLLDVYQFLATREREVTSGTADIAGRDNRCQWWEVDGRISHLKREIKNQTVFTLLNLTASHPAEWISFEQVYRAVGRSSDQARADLRGLTLLIKQLFPNNPGGVWPVDNTKKGSPMQYQMCEEIAHLWS
jgi:hypothetical protein